MAEIIKMPRMSDTMTEGNIVAWHKKEGDKVSPGDLLAEIETDKATMDFESLWEGTLLHIAIKEGVVPVEGLIAVIGKPGEDWQSQAGAGAKAASNGQAKAAEPVPAAAPAVEAVAASAPAAPAAPAASEGRVKASPLAKSIAKEAGIDIAAVQGSGDGGRIVRKDVEAALGNGAAAPAPAAPAAAPVAQAPAISFAAGESFEEKTVSQMRKTIARRLTESKNGAPHFYLTMEINMDSAVAMRPKLNELAAPVKLSFNDIVIKAVAVALRKHPAVNSSWLGDKIRYNHHISIGVAVAVEDGLLVPVVKNADLKSLSAINQEVKVMAEKARNKKLQPDEMSGNTFTISNLGMFGIEEFTGIINPPDACILAVGAIIQKPIVKGGEIAIGNMMKVTLSCDHRVVDGATGAEFLQTLKGILEEPMRLLV
ncbi:MAG: pyruvate dehydrogenase complex dihydrolipoamide acetyltransferase [Saprospiraceae bacterium]|jgi:pyruvate dehydrogenase E2 component (dihydrolipoamide acetyltransferase)|nr:pyruvate dehydrogenase complex dihydrolipoamide acetyltransferase [Saprospiraceae bacterium]